MATASDIPPAHTFAWTTVLALRELGGSGRIEEINERCVQIRQLSEEQQAVQEKRGNRPEVAYRLAWARTLGKELGLLTNSQRSVWTLTELGRAVSETEVEDMKRQRSRTRADNKPPAAPQIVRTAIPDLSDAALVDPGSAEDPETGSPDDWRDQVLAAMKAMDPNAFERLARRLLREAGFVNVTVTGRSGDGGIDGTGVYRMSLVSFPVYFQCKRYQGSVGSNAVRDFRGAMVGRGEKGLVITTGTFTSSAQAEATRDGAPPIDLIDGAQLVDLMRTYELGVQSVVRTVVDVSVDPDFFKTI